MKTRAMAAIFFGGAATMLLAEVRRRKTRRFDLRVLASVRGRGPRGLRKLAAVFDEPAAIVAQAAAIALLAARRDPRAAACMMGAPLAALGVSAILKNAIVRARPPFYFLQRKGLQSFPSSHTAGKGALMWIIAQAFPASRTARVAATLVAAIDVVVVGLDRVADGAHWPTDTLAGAAIGIAAAEAMCCLAPAPLD
jgi:undecaprenyl-diphosphatase